MSFSDEFQISPAVGPETGIYAMQSSNAMQILLLALCVKVG